MGEWSPPINQQEEIGREATVEAPSAQTRKDYTSRPGVLSRFFRISRDGWKSKFKDLKATVKGYKNRLAHMTRSRESGRLRLPRDQRSTTESTEIHGKENPNQLPLSVSFCVFRGYPFVMIFLAGVIWCPRNSSSAGKISNWPTGSS